MGKQEKIIILQACLPDYRLPLFEKLVAAGPPVHLVCGCDYFSASLALCTEPAPWRTYIKNHFLLRRSMLWQSGALNATVQAETLIAEFNPRILSTWVILLRRRLAGRRTLLWGHLWGQYGPQWLTRALRRCMLQLGQGMICYTRSQAEELSEVLPTYPVWVAGNSCVTRESCRATDPTGMANCITYVGRLIKGKKPELLLEAFARATDRLPPDAKLLLIGDGSEWGPLKLRVKELGLVNRVEMPGHIGAEAELKKVYARSVVAVSAGYVGLSAIQSMAYGVPMVVSRREPHSPEIEACQEGQTSLFFETNDAGDLADKLVSFYEPSSPWRARRSKISRFIADNYTFDGMVDAFVAAVETPGARAEEKRSIREAAGSDTPAAPRVALVWAQYGPYHFARLTAFRNKLGAGNVFGIEIGSRTFTYAWRRDPERNRGLITLLPGQATENASAVHIYDAALRVFLRDRIDVVFVPSYWPASSLAIILAARNAGARVVMMNESHAGTSKARGVLAEIKRRLVLQFDSALVGGTPQREYFTSMGLASRKIVTGYDAIDNSLFKARADEARRESDQVRARHALPARYFLNVGRMVWKKNLETLIEAYACTRKRLGSECPALVLVGGGGLEESLRGQCLRLGLSIQSAVPRSNSAVADVYFMGFRQVDELPDFYALADCFVLPSREEEWGLVVNEAMASGLPVLVSKVAGCARDLVREGENGFQFDPSDVVGLSGHLANFALRPELARQMGEVSQRIIAAWGCERFSEAAQAAVDIALDQE